MDAGGSEGSAERGDSATEAEEVEGFGSEFPFSHSGMDRVFMVFAAPLSVFFFFFFFFFNPGDAESEGFGGALLNSEAVADTDGLMLLLLLLLAVGSILEVVVVVELEAAAGFFAGLGEGGVADRLPMEEGLAAATTGAGAAFFFAAGEGLGTGKMSQAPHTHKRATQKYLTSGLPVTLGDEGGEIDGDFLAGASARSYENKACMEAKEEGAYHQQA